jgi:hypothetical protein
LEDPVIYGAFQRTGCRHSREGNPRTAQEDASVCPWSSTHKLKATISNLKEILTFLFFPNFGLFVLKVILRGVRVFPEDDFLPFHLNHVPSAWLSVYLSCRRRQEQQELHVLVFNALASASRDPRVHSGCGLSQEWRTFLREGR